MMHLPFWKRNEAKRPGGGCKVTGFTGEWHGALGGCGFYACVCRVRVTSMIGHGSPTFWDGENRESSIASQEPAVLLHPSSCRPAKLRGHVCKPYRALDRRF